MQSCPVASNHSNRNSFNLKECAVPEKWLTAFVRLEDVAKNPPKKRVSKTRIVESTLSDEPQKKTVVKIDEPEEKTVVKIDEPEKILETLTPPHSPIPCKDPTVTKKKRISESPDVEYEVEKILTHRQQKDRILYLVKWKGWSNDYNTFEPLENLTNCNYLLMEYLEQKEPLPSDVQNMQVTIERKLQKLRIYNRLKKHNYLRQDLEEFSKNCFGINILFQKSVDLNEVENRVAEEYGYIIRCLIALGDQKDKMLFLRAQYYRICLELIRLRRQQMDDLSRSEAAINRLEETKIHISNDVDLESFPKFQYVVEMRHGEDVVIPTDPPLGCECPKGCSTKSNCCSALANSEFAYNSSKILRISETFPIYECNQKCKCSKECPNRVVQQGRKIKLCIFKTKACGWGVKALEPIRKGTFVCEYLGELIHQTEAANREVEYCKRKISYLFDLDFNIDHGTDMYSIDATHCGNVARFVNHSCDPNLVVYPVWVDCLDPNLSRLAFFAKRPIKKNEEITLDYENMREDLDLSIKSEDEQKNSSMRRIPEWRCKCKALNCRGWLFGG